MLFVGSVVLRGCLTSLVGLFHEQEQVIQGDALPVVRGSDEEEGVHERGQAAVAVSRMPVQLRAGAGAQDAHGGVPRVPGLGHRYEDDARVGGVDRDLPAGVRVACGVVLERQAGDRAGWRRASLPGGGRHVRVCFVRQRTRAGEDPGNPKARAGRKWWYTHERLRRAYFRFVGLNRRGVLFAFCDSALTSGGPVASTTNQLEGGVNADIKRVLNAHRGLGEEHMRRCCEWVVYMKSANPVPETFVTPDCWGGTPDPVDATDDGEPAPGAWTDVQLPASGVDAYEGGFGVRTGWAGRS